MKKKCKCDCAKSIFRIEAALRKLRKDLIKNEKAKAQGRPSLLNKRYIAIAKRLHEAMVPCDEICKLMGVSKATLYRYI